MSQKKHILLVDDEVDLQSVLTHLLESLGYEVRTAGNGAEAVKVLDQLLKVGIRPYAIVSDWMMPNGDGIEFLNKLRSGPLKATPFVLMTGAYTPEQLQNAEKLGPDATLSKPFGKALLQNKIEEAVKKRVSKVG